MRQKARLTLAVVVAVIHIATTPLLVTAHTPTAGWVREYATAQQLLTWAEGAAGYPAWVKAAAQSALDVNYTDNATNNSRAPIFDWDAAGQGDVFYQAAMVSPCGTGNPQWLQCANGWGTLTWNIYIRNLQGAPQGNWVWWDTTGSCPAGTTCFYARRALVHEAVHVTLAVGNHDGQGETNTVMGATVPASPNAGWNQTKLRRCDHAAAQLAYDLDNFAGPYADCFDHIVGHGTVGLLTTATVAAASYRQCVGYGQTVTGRIAVKTTADYGRLSDNPLEGRVVRFDRRPVGGSWTLNVASVTAIYAHPGDNWTKSFSSPGGAGTWEYRAHFDGDVALDPSNKPTFTITWSSAC